VTDNPRGSRYVLVAYKKDILVRIPFTSTSLFPAPPVIHETKITPAAVVELLDLAKQFAILTEREGQK
jgi:hypothetical protein